MLARIRRTIQGAGFSSVLSVTTIVTLLTKILRFQQGKMSLIRLLERGTIITSRYATPLKAEQFLWSRECLLTSSSPKSFNSLSLYNISYFMSSNTVGT
jgi:hypothetical protein